uniref:Glycerol-3-phosphate dehydrogenase [NAD(+)] n=1 Tax=Chlamydomonas raudensis TaxID=284013 RepID=A0A7D7QY02_9CHLO|nr:phosphoserine phosphatase-glycerol-3-phosphate dehydrogenase isoform 2 [Chlamydomonas raudensis]
MALAQRSTTMAPRGAAPLPVSTMGRSALPCRVRALPAASRVASIGVASVAIGGRRARASLVCAAAASAKDNQPGSLANPLVVRDKSIPSAADLAIWHRAEAICFDVDCTITTNDGLDLLAEFMGKGEECEKITNQAMDGTVDLSESLEQRLQIINCTPADVKRFIKANPPQSRLAPGIVPFIKALKSRGIHIFLLTGGFREIMLPIAAYLDIPMENVFANRMLWQWDDETMEPTKLVGFDTSEPTSRNQGKPEAIMQIRDKYPYNSVVMIGDGITDLEAVQVTGAADLFIGYGGIIEREMVKSEADWYVTDWAVLQASLQKYKVAMIGSGAWACAAVTLCSANVAPENKLDLFQEKIQMWTYEEQIDGKNLTDIINETHENPKYLPGTLLGDNVVANPDLISAVSDADVIILCAPHQFVRGICKQLAGKVKPGAIAVSLIKGMRVRSDGPQLISQMVTRSLGIDCSVLMGANIASGIASKELSEATIGYNSYDNARLLQKLFQREYFGITLVRDVAGAEMCGTLKNIVALAAGMVDGLGLGANTKAAIIRKGLDEMRRFSRALYPSISDGTFLESCGMADLIATCYGGRNRLVAMEYTKAFMTGNKVTFAALEDSLLNGQKLQGVLTSNEVQEILEIRGWEKEYPLFTTINAIVNGKVPPVSVTHFMAMGVLPKGVKAKAPSAPQVGEKKRGPVDLVFTVDDLSEEAMAK